MFRTHPFLPLIINLICKINVFKIICKVGYNKTPDNITRIYFQDNINLNFEFIFKLNILKVKLKLA